jgi:hypothetical protein
MDTEDIKGLPRVEIPRGVTGDRGFQGSPPPTLSTPAPRSLSGSMMLALRETPYDQIADLDGQLIRQARASLN